MTALKAIVLNKESIKNVASANGLSEATYITPTVEIRFCRLN